MLTGRYLRGERPVRSAMADLLGLSISIGMVSKAERKAIAAPALNVDETGRRQAGRRAWPWAAVAKGMTLFRIDASRGSAALRRLVGEAIAPVIVSDRHPTSKVVPTRQVCWAHLMKNALAYVPRAEMQAEVVADLRAVFDAPDRPEAERRLASAVTKHRKPAPVLAEWLEANFAEGSSVYAVPRAHRRPLRTSNMLERLDEELKRRTRVAGLFPNDASLLRPASAVLMEISDEWETNRVYLTMGPA